MHKYIHTYKFMYFVLGPMLTLRALILCIRACLFTYTYTQGEDMY
jgi:hypothetical protein